MRLTPEEMAIHNNWEATTDAQFIRPDVPGSRGRLTPEEMSIHDRADGIVPVVDDPTETPAAAERREMVEHATENLMGETPMEGEDGAKGCKYSGGVAAGMRFVLRNESGVPVGVMTAPVMFDEADAYAVYTLVLRRDLEGRVAEVRIEIDHRQSYSSQYTPEQYDIPLPKVLRGELTPAGKAMAQRLVEVGAMKQEAPKPPMPVKPFVGFRKKKG